MWFYHILLIVSALIHLSHIHKNIRLNILLILSTIMHIWHRCATNVAISLSRACSRSPHCRLTREMSSMQQHVLLLLYLSLNMDNLCKNCCHIGVIVLQFVTWLDDHYDIRTLFLILDHSVKLIMIGIRIMTHKYGLVLCKV